uniref:MARVEL domain-containing protein n=1 Tax=Onchocerca volvulus TaxID=6282 RepID=A0A8R1TR20_ONCVO
MGDISLNTRYLSSNLGIVKIMQICIGFVVCCLLCTSWYDGRSCFGEGRIGFCSGLNFVALIINIVFFIVNLLNISAWKMERIFSAICTVLFLIASILLIWFIIERNASQASLIITAVSNFFLFFSVIREIRLMNPNFESKTFKCINTLLFIDFPPK